MEVEEKYIKIFEDAEIVKICRTLNLKPMNNNFYPRKLSFLISFFYGFKFFSCGFLILLIIMIFGYNMFVGGLLLLFIYLGFKYFKHKREALIIVKSYKIKSHFSYKDWLMVLNQDLKLYKIIHCQKITLLKMLFDNSYLDIVNTHHYHIYKGFKMVGFLKDLK